MQMLGRWKQHALELKTEAYALGLAVKHPGTSWYAKALAAAVVAYALCPIDLIPDFIPIIGYVDDLLLVPLGIALALKLIPPQIVSECRAQAETSMQEVRPTSWIAAAIIIAIWVLTAAIVVAVALRSVQRRIRDHSLLP